VKCNLLVLVVLISTPFSHFLFSSSTAFIFPLKASRQNEVARVCRRRQGISNTWEAFAYLYLSVCTQRSLFLSRNARFHPTTLHPPSRDVPYLLATQLYMTICMSACVVSTHAQRPTHVRKENRLFTEYLENLLT